MNLAGLETFVAILEEGSLVGAAQRLHVTQSTITARLQNLERDIGTQLIERSKSGATPTAAGERLRRNAETILDLWNQAQRDASLPDAVHSVCTLGCHPDLWIGWGEQIVAAARQASTGLAVSVRSGSAVELSEWQSSGRVDVSLTYSPTVAAGHRIHRLGDDELVLVSDAPDTPIEFDPGYVFVDGGEQFAKDHAAAYATANIARLSFGTASLGLAHLLARGGSAYLPRRLVDPHLGTGTLHLLTAPTFQRDVHLVAPVDAGDAWPWLEALLD